MPAIREGDAGDLAEARGRAAAESTIDKAGPSPPLCRPAMLDVLLLFSCFAVVVYGLGPALIPAGFGTPLQRMAAGVAASLVLVYLLGFAIYAANLPRTAYWAIPALAVVVVAVRSHRLAELCADRETITGLVGWLALACWLLGWQVTVFSYSGATWQADWYEHYHRAKFFLDHWDLHTRFLATYSLAARPPLVNIDAAAFLALVGSKFSLYQVVAVLLASVVIWPVLLLQRAFTRAGTPLRVGWAVLLLLALPALVQNATFTWTKAPVTFFILLGVAFLADPVPCFPRRLAGWLGVTAGMLAHYSAGPWVVALGAAECVRDPAIVRRCFTRRGLAIGAACVLLFSTWLGWSLVNLGGGETFGSNSTVADGAGLSPGQRLGHAALNLYYTTVPVALRPVDYGPYQPGDRWVAVRDGFFNCVQSSAPLMAGLCGIAVALALMVAERRQLDWRAARFWAPLVITALVVGTAVHTEVINLGIAQICLLPLALIAVAWVAARVPAHPRLRLVTLGGVGLDFLLGIALHFAVQSFWLLRHRFPGKADWELAQLLGHGGKTNFEARQYIVAQPYLSELPGAGLATVTLLLLALVLLHATFAADGPAAKRGSPGDPAAV